MLESVYRIVLTALLILLTSAAHADRRFDLASMVRGKDPGSASLARELGLAALETLRPLASDPDAVVRMIALGCLREIPGPQSTGLLIDALPDESPTTSVEALRGLEERIGNFPAQPLLSIYHHIDDPDRREQVALILARLPDATSENLQALLTTESSLRAREGLQVGLAMRGSGKAQMLVLEALSQSWNEEMKRWLNIVKLIDQDWALRGLLGLLDDEIPLIFIGVDGLDDRGAQYLRACDIVVNILARAYPRGFPFRIDDATQYSPGQRCQAKRHFQQVVGPAPGACTP